MTDQEIQETEAEAPQGDESVSDVSIDNEAYYVFPETTKTICSLMLSNGVNVVGEASLIRPQEEARRQARADALRKLAGAEAQPDQTSPNIEKMILDAGVTGPRITPEHIESTIVDESYNHVPGTTLTICILKLVNGFTVTGESACVSPDNFNAEIGRKIAREHAKAKIWLLEGYVLQYAAYAVSRSEDIARIAHEVNRGYCQSLGDYSVPTWFEAPDWQKDSIRNGVAFHLGNPHAGAEASHENWLAQKRAEGWTYGPEKNAEKKEHPCMVEFKDLPIAQQAKDHIFRAIVHAMAFPLQI